MQYADQVHFAEHIQRIVAGGTVCAHRQGNAHLQHFFHRGNATGQLGVGAGIQHCVNAVFFVNIQVLIADPDTVKCTAPVVPQPQLLKQRRRGHAVAADAALHLALRLTGVHIHRRLVLLCQRRNGLHNGAVGGVLCVEPQLVGHQRVMVVVGVVVFIQKCRAFLKIIDRTAHYRAEPGVHRRLCHGFRKVVHIKAGGNTALQILQECQSGQMINILCG